MSAARQRGMSLVAVMFMIVVLAAFAVFAMRVGAAGEQDVTTELMSARAMFAARAGIELGANRAVPAAASCAVHPAAAIDGVPFALTQGSLNGFAVTVTFNCTDHVIGGTTHQAFNLVSTATRGAYGSPDYVARTLVKTVVN